MGFFDLFTLILDNLGRRKARVALTAIGVVIGTAAVVILVSLGLSLQQNFNSQVWGAGDLSMIQIMPKYEDMPIGPGGGGFGGSGGVGSPGVPNQTLVTDKTLEDVAAIPGVEVVIPYDFLQYGGQIRYNRLETWAGITGIGVEDLKSIGLTAAQGVTTLERGTVVIGPLVPRNFYDPRLRPGQEPPPPPELLGETLQLILVKYDQQGNETRRTVAVRVAGILEEKRGESDWSMYMPISQVTAYNEWGNGRRINRNRDGYPFAYARAAEARDALEIADKISALGYNVFSPQDFLQGTNTFFIILQVIFGGVGAISLLVAAIGIANTMAMAILERTREIGLMKAIGATNRDVLMIFLGESAGIGFIGGLGGVILGWSLGQLLNVLAVAYLAGQAVQTGGPPPPTSAITTPLWLPGFALAFATLVGLLSGIYPALRAATLIPINALKYE